ncbi:MAG TPA: carboxypeptidase-like regulatory domain-containing protein, partial [Chitinophagaceae bacterium]|nr:carboxypeptidase-like regulatory domain-containing protein [Chitinophagaceae bacterium]
MRKLVFLLLGVALLCTQLLAQNRTISGTVSDDKGNPLPNVSVQIKGTNTGTVTSASGVYSLTVGPDARTLVFSAVDMTPQEVAIGTSTVINATLQLANRNLDEVVVVGYQQRRKRDEAG